MLPIPAHVSRLSSSPRRSGRTRWRPRAPRSPRRPGRHSRRRRLCTQERTVHDRVSAQTGETGPEADVSGLAYARAGLNLTILSNAISSSRTRQRDARRPNPCAGRGHLSDGGAGPAGDRARRLQGAPALRQPPGRAMNSLRVARPGSPSGGPGAPLCVCRDRIHGAAQRSCGERVSARRRLQGLQPQHGLRDGIADFTSSWPGPESRSPGGTRPRRAPAGRRSPNATAG